MDNPAVLADLADRDYDGPASATAQQTRLDEAWRALHREVPSIEVSLTAGDVTVADVVDVLCAATLRVLRNPEGYAEGSEAVDDYRETWKRADASPDLYFTSAEIRRLQPPDAYGSGFVGSIKYV